MKSDHTQVNGSAGEHLATAALLLAGYKVFHQDHDSGSSDLVVERNSRLERVSVRSFYGDANWTRTKKHAVKCADVRAGDSIIRGGLRDARKEVEHFALVDLDTGEVFLLPAALAPRSRISKNKTAELATRLFPK